METMKTMGLLAVVMAVTACTSTISKINADGTPRGEVVFPDLADATQPEGIFPNLENLAKIDPGMSKKDLYYLIERPHFHEINGAKEWDYIMKFRQADRSVKTCQYKILFDKDNIARNFYWKPANCLDEKVNLSADALFPLNRGGIADIKPAGKKKLDALAKQIVAERNKPRLFVTGYTDYLGSESYNLRLSQQRAESVKQYLTNQGVKAENITAVGKGESDPVVTCGKKRGAVLVQCLQPNRRVTVEIKR